MSGADGETRPRPRSVGGAGFAADAIRGFPKTQIALLRERRRRGSDSVVFVGDKRETSSRPQSVGASIVNDFRDRRALLSTPEARALLVETPEGGRRSPPSRSKSASLLATTMPASARPRSSPHVGDGGAIFAASPSSPSSSSTLRTKSAHLSVFDVNTLRRDAENLRIYKGIHGAVSLRLSTNVFQTVIRKLTPRQQTPPRAHDFHSLSRSGSAKLGSRDGKRRRRRRGRR